MTDIRKVTVLGTGVLGAQIAFHTAFKGFDVTAYDINDEAVDKARTTYDKLAKTYSTEKVDGGADGGPDGALSRITLTTDLAEAARDADLIIEAIPEIIDVKRETYDKLSKIAPERTIFATNSSSLLPSDMADSTGRPDRFIAMHFANMIWLANTAEIMGTKQTSKEVFDTIVAFAEQIGMVPIPIHKEKAGYILNTIVIPFYNAAMELASNGYADPKAVDNAWRVGTNSPRGPFQMMDISGLNTAYNIASAGSEKEKGYAEWLKENYIDKGRLGLSTGKGFYDYDDDGNIIDT